MALTEAQKTTLGTHIRANAAMDTFVADSNHGAIRDAYNAEAIPTVWVFLDQLDVDAANAAIAWPSDYATFADKMTAIAFLFKNGSYAIRSPGARAALNTVFAGCGTTQLAILSAGTRKASLAESLYIETTTGPGGGDGSAQADSAITGWAGDVSATEIDEALELTLP